MTKARHKSRKLSASLVKIGLVSRIDYGSNGFRCGLLHLMAQIFEKEKVQFVVVCGGLISRELKHRLSLELKGVRGDDRQEVEDEFIKQHVSYLTAHFPRVKSPEPQKQWLKTYIVTSPAYDGDLGYTIARRLARKRSDIQHWGHGYGIFPTRREGYDLAVLTPQKAAWLRGKYYSTPVERVILDWTNQNYSEQPHILVVGCFGSDIQKPGGGESTLPFIAVPALSRLWESHVGSENQVGVTILEYAENGLEIIKVYYFNDLLSRENEYIKPPPKADIVQRQIVETLKARGPLTVGLLQDALKTPNRKHLLKKINQLQGCAPTKSWPGLCFDDASHRYFFNPQWLENNLRFPKPRGKVKEDSLVAFGCLHAGCIHTNYQFFIDTLPQIIIDRNVDLLVGAGDFVEGTKHHLIFKEEVYGGLNNTRQERLAGRCVGEVILRVFESRAEKLVKNRKYISSSFLQRVMDESLIPFVYISGNHCAWSKEVGFVPLQIFRQQLIDHITGGIQAWLAKKRLCFAKLNQIVKSKVIESNIYTFPSGIKVAIFHPYMCRTLTTSIRLQQVLGFANEGSVVVSANFHVAEALGEWRVDTGQRKVLQVGTIKSRSDFEDNRLKKVDSGVGYLKISSIKGRIISTETIFYTAGASVDLNNDFVEESLCQRFNIRIFNHK